MWSEQAMHSNEENELQWSSSKTSVDVVRHPIARGTQASLQGGHEGTLKHLSTFYMHCNIAPMLPISM